MHGRSLALRAYSRSCYILQFSVLQSGTFRRSSMQHMAAELSVGWRLIKRKLKHDSVSAWTRAAASDHQIFSCMILRAIGENAVIARAVVGFRSNSHRCLECNERKWGSTSPKRKVRVDCPPTPHVLSNDTKPQIFLEAWKVS